MYFVFVFQRELLRLVLFKDYLLVLSMFVLPLLLMLLSDILSNVIHIRQLFASCWYSLLQPCWHCEPISNELWRSLPLQLWRLVRP